MATSKKAPAKAPAKKAAPKPKPVAVKASVPKTIKTQYIDPAEGYLVTDEEDENLCFKIQDTADIPAVLAALTGE